MMGENMNRGRTKKMESKLRIESRKLRVFLLIAGLVIPLAFVLVPSMIFGSQWETLRQNYLLSVTVRLSGTLVVGFAVFFVVWFLDLVLRRESKR
jgi:hypothetical protein